MALDVWVGSVLQKTTTGNQAYTPAGLDFTPKTLLFFAPNRTSDGSAASFLLGMGAAVSSSSRFGVSASSLDAAANSNTDRASNIERCLTLYNGVNIGSADLVSFDANGFTLNWTVTDGTARVWNVIALGGSDLTDVAIVQLTSPTSTGNVDYTSLSFQPDCIMPFTIASATAATATANALLGMGFGTASNQASLGVSSEDSQGTMDSERTQDTVPVINTSFNGVRFLVAQLVSMLSNGFRLNWTTVQGTGRVCWVLCLKGGNYKVGTFNQATGTGVQGYSLTTFTPTGIIVGSFNNVTASAITASSRVSIGAASGTTERGCIWSGDTDNVPDSICDQDLDRTKLIKMLTEGTPTLDAAGDLSAFNSDGISINWTTADGTAREIIYLAFGSAASDTSVTPDPVTVPIVLPTPTTGYEAAPTALTIPLVLTTATLDYAIVPSAVAIPVAFADAALGYEAVSDPVTVPVVIPAPTTNYASAASPIAVPIVIPTPILTEEGDIVVTPDPVVITIGLTTPTTLYEVATGAIAVPVVLPGGTLGYAAASSAVTVPIVIPTPSTDHVLVPSPVLVPVVIPIPVLDEGGDSVEPDPVVIVIEFPTIVFTITEEEFCLNDWNLDESLGVGDAPSDSEFTESPDELIVTGRIHDWNIG